jgi:predicted transglutaminase-like cysteine proteinase
VRQAILTIAVAGAITATVAIDQVAKADLLPQPVTDKNLQQAKSNGPVAFTDQLQLSSDGPVALTNPLQFKSDGADANTDPQQFKPDSPVAFADLQQPTGFSNWPVKLDSPPVTSLDSGYAAYWSAEALQLVSLEQPEQHEAAAPAHSLGLAPERSAALEQPRDTDLPPAPQSALPSSHIQFGTPVLAPMAHTFFCLKYPDDCKVHEMVFRGGALTLTAKRWAELVRINTDVNRAIIPQPNTKGLAGEKWLISPRAGECHDYAVTKRHELLALGWPEQDLLLSEVVTSWGEHHLVLVIRTSDGDFVADNLNPNIRPWTQAPYQWVRIQSPGNPLIWSTLVSTTVTVRARASGQTNPS